MGNLSSSINSHHVGKVVLLDGSIQEFYEPTTAAELMLEHPQQVVVEFINNKPSSSSKKERQIRPTPLPADTKLEANKIYLMLPLRRGRLPSFSSQDARQMLLRVNAIFGTQSFLPSSSTSSRTLRVLAKIRPLNAREGENEEDGDLFVGRKDHLTRQVSGKGWKPALDTIKENKEGRKEVNWVTLASNIGKRIGTKGLVWG